MRPMRSVFLFFLCTVIVLGVIFWNNFVIQTQELSIRLKKLPPSFDGLRIALLTDLHGREFDAENQYLLTEVKRQTPDLIFISGDLFDEETDLSFLQPLIGGLCAIAPTFYVTGNHEWQLDHLKSILSDIESYGATVLRNEYTVLRRGEEKLIIAGVDDPCGPYDQKTPEQLVSEIRRNEGENACILMLAHRNDTLPMWSDLGVDLVLTGHCHGGVVRLPFVGGVFGTNRELFPNYDAGLYSQSDTQLFVSRGLGYTNVRLRLFNRPHLPILILNS